jgi:Fe-S-cluster containining protein
MDPIQRYFDLIRRIDGEAKRLTALHGKAITCHPGCTGCCVNLTVFPVEFHAIRLAMAQAGMAPRTVAFDTAAACGFLQDGLCRIYPFRPVICRTHGLPILYLDDASGEYIWEVSFCERNFTGLEQIEFTDDTILNIEEINKELSRINLDFVDRSNRSDETFPHRIPLATLCRAIREKTD